MHSLFLIVPAIVCGAGFAMFAASVYEDVRRPAIGLPRREIVLGAAAAALSVAGFAVCAAGIVSWVLA